MEDAQQRIDEIIHRKPPYPAVINCLASGVACAGFCFLNRGGLVECSVVAIAALCGQILRRAMLKRHANHFGVWMLCGLLASLIYMGISQALLLSGLLSVGHPQGIIPGSRFPPGNRNIRPGKDGFPGRNFPHDLRSNAGYLSRDFGVDGCHYISVAY